MKRHSQPTLGGRHHACGGSLSSGMERWLVKTGCLLLYFAHFIKQDRKNSFWKWERTVAMGVGGGPKVIISIDGDDSKNDVLEKRKGRFHIISFRALEFATYGRANLHIGYV